MSDQGDDDAEYKVGYGKPPKQHRIKKGEVRNPRGRPRKAQSFEAFLNAELAQVMAVTEGGRSLKVTKMQLGAKRLVNDFVMGKSSGRDHVLRLIDRGAGAESGFTITDEDREAFAQAVHNAGKKHGDHEPGDGGGWG
jgi:hypothetical protein